MTTSSLKNKSFTGALWSGLESFSQQILQFVISIVLARLLSPEEFGTLGLVTVFMIVLHSFVDGGFSLSLIQAQDVSHKDESSVFYFNIMLSIVAGGCFYVLSKSIALFYGIPELTKITKSLSVVFVIDALGSIHHTLLRKRIDFKPQWFVSITSRILSGGIAILLAYNGFGVWALVYQIILRSIFTTISYWVFSSWRPLAYFSLGSIKKFFNYGSNILFSSLLSVVSSNLYLLIIGKLFSPTDLGFYTRAKQFTLFPQNLISHSGSKISFSVLASVQNDKERFVNIARKGLNTLLFISTPIFTSIIILAKPTITVLITEKWLECTPYLQLFAILGLIFPWHLMNVQMLMSYGRSDLNLKIEIIKNVLQFTNLFITWKYGITAILTGLITISIIGLYINTIYSKKLFEYGLGKQFSDVYRYFILALITTTPLYIIAHQTDYSFDLFTLSSLYLLAGLLYLASSMVFNIGIAKELKNLLYEYFNSHKK